MATEVPREFIVEPDAIWPSAHAASIVELPSGNLMASWFAGSREGAPDCAIWTAERSEEGWSAPTRAIDSPGISDGNSVLWLDGAGTLRIWYVTMEGKGWATCPVRERRSPDSGRTWSPEEYVRKEHGWMVRNEPVQWNGRVLMPMYDERNWTSFVLVSEDGGETWSESERLRAKVGIIQPALAELRDGRLLMFLRSTDGVIYQSFSADDAATRWTRPEPASLPNPNSAMDLATLDTGGLLLVYNPTRHGRSPLRVALSDDEGETWPTWRDLETEDGEYSYPTAIQTSEGAAADIQVLYTWRRRTIACASFNETWLREGGDSGSDA